jgi:4-hydroxybenzoate polyprenyltransferase
LNSKSFWTVVSGFILFTLTTSAVYLINDIIDLPKDRAHPIKKKRPIATGELPIPIALFVAVAFLIISLSLATSQNYFFFLVLLAYFLLQIAYSLLLKSIIVLDVMAIAAGFILRVYAGAILINVHMNVWFLLCLVSLALFLAVGKRRAELAVLATDGKSKDASLYTPGLLEAYLAMFGNSAWIAYALFAFFTSPPVVINRLKLLKELPLALSGINKWLMLTIPMVIYGIMRYMVIIYHSTKAESPERVLLSDWPLLSTVVIWGLSVLWIIYVVTP